MTSFRTELDQDSFFGALGTLTAGQIEYKGIGGENRTDDPLQILGRLNSTSPAAGHLTNDPRQKVGLGS